MRTLQSNTIWKRRWTFLWSLFAPYRGMLLALVLLYSLNYIALQTSDQFLRQIVNELGPYRDLTFFLLLVGMNFAFREISGIFFWCAGHIYNQIGFRSSEQLLEALRSKATCKTPYESYSQPQVASTFLSTSDTLLDNPTIWSALLGTILSAILSSIAALISLFLIGPIFALLGVLLPLPCLVVSRWLITRKNYTKLSYLVTEGSSQVEALHLEIFSAGSLEDFQSLGGGKWAADLPKPAFKRFSKVKVRQKMTDRLHMLLLDSQIQISVICIYLVGEGLLHFGMGKVGDIVAAAVILDQLLTNLAGDANLPDRLHSAGLLLDRCEQLLKLPERLVSPGDATDSTGSAKIILQNVSYIYKNSTDSDTHLTDETGNSVGIHNISLCISPGFYAIAGPSGAGKSTLTKVIEGTLQPQSGTVLVESEDMFPANGLLRVPQEFGAFVSATARELVVRSSRLPFTDEQIRESLRLAGLAEYTYRLDEVVPARKSGGEVQRWRIARVFLLCPYVNGVIIDEGFASIDYPQAKEILRALRQAFKEKILIIVTHNLHFVEDADTIIVVKAGQIVEQGSHVVLLADLGEYHRLYTGSLLEKEDDMYETHQVASILG